MIESEGGDIGNRKYKNMERQTKMNVVVCSQKLTIACSLGFLDTKQNIQPNITL